MTVYAASTLFSTTVAGDGALTSDEITDATAPGRNLLKAPTVADQVTALGLSDEVAAVANITANLAANLTAANTYTDATFLKLSGGERWFGATSSDVATAYVPGSVTAIATLSYATPGDGGGARLIRKTASLPLYVTDAGGGQWSVDPNQEITANMFGARDDLTFDSQPAIQAAIDYCIYRNKASGGVVSGGIVRLLAGRYRIDDTIHLGYGESFHCAQLVGAGRRYRSSTGMCGTSIECTFSDRPGIAVSGGRRSAVRALTIKGKNFDWITNNNLGVFAAPTLNDLLPETWLDPALPASASSRYAPYAGIAIDPYAGPAPAVAYPAVTYPDWSGITTQYNKNYSADTMIDDVEIAGFVVAVANQPCDADGNGDFTKFQNGLIECCQYAFSIGNTQSRLICVSNSEIYRVHTLVVTGINGRRLGKPSVLFLSTEISFSIYITNVPTMSLGGGLTFRNCYGETIYAIGSCPTAGGTRRYAPVSFESCEFMFDRTYRGVPATLFSYPQGGPVSFRDCVFSTTSGVNNFHFDVDAATARFEGCTIWVDPNTVKLYEKHAVNASCGITFSRGQANCAAFDVRVTERWDLNSGASPGAGVINGRSNSTNRATCLPIYAHTPRAKNTSDPGVGVAAAMVAWAKGSAASITTAGRTVTADMTGTGAASWSFVQGGGDVGDIIIDDITNTVFFVAARTGLTLTLVAQNNYDASGALIAPITTAGNFYMINCRRYLPGYVTYGDTTAGNATIANFGRSDGWSGYINSVADGVQVNDYLWVGSGDVIRPTTPTGAMITAIGATSITLSSTMTKTETGARQSVFVRAAPANNT